MSPTNDAASVRRRDELRRFQQGAFVLAALALLVGLALLPRGDELLLIHVRNREIGRARAMLSDATQRISTIASVEAHNELSLLEGRVDEALVDLERYTAQHPDDANAWRRLAQMYGEAQRLDDQIRATARLYALQPGSALARRLVSFYRWSADEASEAKVLRDLVTSGEATADEYLRGARVAAALGQTREAFDTIERLRRREPGAFDYPAMELYANLRLDAEGAAGLAGPVQMLPIVKQQPESLAQLARTLSAWGHPDVALALFETAPGIAPPAERLEMRARMAVGTPHAGRVVRELMAPELSARLTDDVRDALVTLALSVDDYDAVATVLASTGPVERSAWLARAIGEALAHDSRPRAQQLLMQFGDEALIDSPVLALELAAERGDTSRAREWIGRLDANAALSLDEQTAVAAVEMSMGDDAAAFARLSRVVPMAEAPDWAAGPFAALAVSMHREDEALDLLNRGDAAHASHAVLQALDVLFARVSETGDLRRAVRVAERLAATRATDADAERLEYALATAVPDNPDLLPQLRRVYAEHLAAPSLPEARRLQLIDGLWNAGERASLLEPIAALASRDLSHWLSPLMEAARAAGRTEVATAVIDASLPRDRDRPPTQAEIDAVRALMDLQAADDRLLPHLERMARTVGDTWVFAYDERLDRLNDRAARIALWTFVGGQPDQAPADRRAAAARLVELGEPRSAAAILEPLAMFAAPTDGDVVQLLALWGATLAPGQLDWLQQRLLGAAPAEQAAWLELLAPRLAADADRLETLGATLIARSETTPETLSALGHAALGHNATTLAQRAFVTLRTVRPDDLDALRWVGTLAFYAGHTSEARTSLEDYVGRGGREPEPLYQLGELLRSAHDEDQASHLYQQALAVLTATTPLPAASRPLLANVLVRVGERQRASETFEALLRDTPSADHLRADYVVALIQWDDFGGAARVLAAQPSTATAAATTASADISGPRRLDLLRVQVLTHDGRYREALRLLDQLVARYPNDPDVWIARGAFDADRGRPADADLAYAAASTHAPQREDITRLRDQRAWQQAPQLAMTSEARSISNAWDEQSSSLSASGRLGVDGTFSLLADRHRFDAPRVLRADGSLNPLHTELQRIEVTATVPLGAASTLTPVFFAATGSRSTVGSGLQWTHDDLRGRSEASAEVGRPFWEFLESAADDGVRDRLAAQRQWRFRPDTATWVQAALNRYRLASGHHAESLALTVGVIRTVRRESPALTLQYGLDKETRLRASTTTTDSGFTFNPLPLASREVHLGGVIARYGVAHIWDAETTAGYTADRFGGHGSFFTTRLSPKWGAKAGVSFWIDRRLYAIATTQQVLRGGAQLMVRFRR